MTAYLQENAPPEVAQELDRLEKQADECEFGLRLYSYPFSTAVRAILCQSMLSIEDAIEKFGIGSQRHRDVMTNLSNAVVTALGWVNKHCDLSGKRGWKWNKRLAAAALEIQNTAHNYSCFLSNYPMWHKNRIAAELVGQNCIRFSSVAGSEQRRIRAYQQGARIPEWPTTIDEPIGGDFVSNSEIANLITDLLPHCRQSGFLGFTYPEPFDLWTNLNAIYLKRMEDISRWPGTLQLDGYSMVQFRRFYAALLSLCGVHEFLCYFIADKNKRYPVNSAILAKTQIEWTDILTRISELDQKIVSSILADLTFGRIRALNLYVHPFIPGDINGTILFLAPQFPLNSRAEENILRVFSYTHQKEYQTFSNSKEDEMRKDLISSCPERFKMSGPAVLPQGDIDLLIEDAKSATLVVAEMKWNRKTIRVWEHIDRDKELHYGFKQLNRSRAFLLDNPDYLRSKGMIDLSIIEYRNIYFLLVARDHLLWIKPENDRYIVAYDAFKKALNNHLALEDGIGELIKYDWLPKEGRDFFVKFERASVNGVTAEAEIFHRVQIQTPK